VKQHSYNGLAGCVKQSRSRLTGTLVGLYHGEQSGLESDPNCIWVTVCEEHSTLVGHQTLVLAKSWMADPSGWCDDCRDAPTNCQIAAVAPAPPQDSGAAYIALTSPAKCGCGRMAYFVVNRDGKTLCLDCDGKV
jgi:hypothetical protein